MDKHDFEALSDIRLSEAQVLFAAGYWSGAYYLAGYAVECALKACIAGLFKSETFPEKMFSDKCYVHDIEKLVVLAGLKADRDAANNANANLSANWAIVKDWTEQSRYDQKLQIDADELLKAITDANDGVFAWIKSFW